MKKRSTIPILLATFLLFPLMVFPKDGDFGLSVKPVYAVPFGPKLDDGTPWYSSGGGISVQGEYDIPKTPFLVAELGVDVDYLPINNGSGGLTALYAGAGIGARFPVLPRFQFKVSAGGGYCYAMHIDESGSLPYVYGGAGLDFRLSPSLNLGVGGNYKQTISSGGGIYSGLNISFGIGYSLTASRRGADLRFMPNIQTIYPLYYTYYDKHPLGTLSIRNTEDTAVQKVKVSFSVPQFMDRPSVCAELPSIPGKGSVDVPLTAVFTNTIFNVTEGLKVAAEVRIEYEYVGKYINVSRPLTLTVQNRNAMTWDDDRKVAAFMSSNHPLVKGYAKNLAATVRGDSLKAFNNEFRIAVGIFTMLESYGMQYIPDSSSPFAVLSEKPEQVDQILFPVESLNYKAGDCDDLSVLYATLLEAAGLETAFITTPGHIYAAFNLGLTPRQAEGLFPDTSDMIEYDGKMWVPVEITLIGQGFVKAWQIGAQQWRAAADRKTGGFLPVREAWKIYTPAEAALQAALFLPNPKEVLPPYRTELNRYIDRRLNEMITRLTGEIRQTGGNPLLYNRLGVLYAKYGRMDDAATQFRAAVAKEEYFPALINLGNVHYLKEEFAAAQTMYRRALNERPENASALLGVIKTGYEMEQYAVVNESLARLRALNPGAAESVAYMSSGAGGMRASEAATKSIEGWNE